MPGIKRVIPFTVFYVDSCLESLSPYGSNYPNHRSTLHYSYEVTSSWVTQSIYDVMDVKITPLVRRRRITFRWVTTHPYQPQISHCRRPILVLLEPFSEPLVRQVNLVRPHPTVLLTSRGLSSTVVFILSTLSYPYPVTTVPVDYLVADRIDKVEFFYFSYFWNRYRSLLNANLSTV